MKNYPPALLAASLGSLSCVLAACSVRSDVSLTGNTPSRYSHVWITTQEVWLNTSSTAGPDDGGWVRFSLSTPTTVDLVQENGGNLGDAITDLNIVPGTYAQIRLIPLDDSTPRTSSAQSAGALYNSEADVVEGGTTHQLPLELLNPDKGIGIQASLRVPVGSISSALSTTSTGAAAGTTAGTTFGGTSFGGTTTGTITPGSTTSSTTSTPRNQFAINFDGSTDLVPFSYGTPAASGILLSSHASAYDLSQVGGISGTVTLTGITGTSSSGLPNIVATAEVLSADGTRHVPVVSAPVSATGNFLIYPLNSSSSHPASYDVVIHGPGIATIIIKGVVLAIPSASALTSSTTTGTTGTTTTGTTTTPATTTTTGSTSSSTSSGTATCSSGTASSPFASCTTSDTTATSATTSDGTSITVNAVAIGTLFPRTAKTYTASVGPSSGTRLPAGALIGFYQTLDTAGEVPYLIEASPIDPFNQVLANAQTLSAGTIDSGTWTSSSANVTVVSVAPHEGEGNYTVSATAPSYAGGAFTKLSAPTSSTATPVPVSLSALTLASGVSAGSITVAVTEARAGKYDHGEVLVSQDGQLVATATIDTTLTSGAGGKVTVSGVPADTSSAIYYLSVRTWNSRISSDPAKTLHRQSYPTAVDLRSSTSGSIELAVN